jgi:hypothetical protein
LKELIRHLLFVKFKEGVLQGDIVRARSEFSEIQNKIEGLSGFEWGENTSPEGFSGDLHIVSNSFLLMKKHVIDIFRIQIMKS